MKVLKVGGRYCEANTTKGRSVCSPGFFSCAYLAEDGVHPHDLVPDHAEEAQLVRLGGDLQATLLAGRQQLLPAVHHLVLAAGDGVGLLARVHRSQLGGALLQLTHLECGGGGWGAAFRKQAQQKEAGEQKSVFFLQMTPLFSRRGNSS